ncbi:toxic anion resistance protein [bacterium]|nr:toxic anion resistance protein [bacterium]
MAKNKTTKLFDAETENISKMKQIATINKMNLTKAEVKNLEKIGSSLKIEDPNSITNYGCELQSIMSSNADSMIANARASKVDEIGEIVTDLLSELNMIDVDDLTNSQSSIKRFFSKLPLIGGLIKQAQNQMVKYESVKSNLQDIEQKIFATRTIALRDNSSLQVMFENNIEYINQIEQLIMAGKMRLQQIRQELVDFQDDPNFELYERNQYENFINHLDKKIDDLSRVQYVLKQNLLQIQAVQSNNVSIAEKANDICTLTIPLWKSQISLALALSDQKKNIEAQRRITDATNDLLQKEAEMLKQNSIDVARENERSVIDIETLRKTQQLLIETVQEVRRIHEEGTQQRINAEQELVQLANDFKNGVSNMLSVTHDNYVPKQLKEISNVDDADFTDVA